MMHLLQLSQLPLSDKGKQINKKKVVVLVVVVLVVVIVVYVCFRLCESVVFYIFTSLPLPCLDLCCSKQCMSCFLYALFLYILLLYFLFNIYSNNREISASVNMTVRNASGHTLVTWTGPEQMYTLETTNTTSDYVTVTIQLPTDESANNFFWWIGFEGKGESGCQRSS